MFNDIPAICLITMIMDKINTEKICNNVIFGKESWPEASLPTDMEASVSVLPQEQAFLCHAEMSRVTFFRLRPHSCSTL